MLMFMTQIPQIALTCYPLIFYYCRKFLNNRHLVSRGVNKYDNSINFHFHSSDRHRLRREVPIKAGKLTWKTTTKRPKTANRAVPICRESCLSSPRCQAFKKKQSNGGENTVLSDLSSWLLCLLTNWDSLGELLQVLSAYDVSSQVRRVPGSSYGHASSTPAQTDTTSFCCCPPRQLLADTRQVIIRTQAVVLLTSIGLDLSAGSCIPQLFVSFPLTDNH